ncbi:lytic transglycosylase domain-containing protein [Ornithobacterium rhinotracheale]
MADTLFIDNYNFNQKENATYYSTKFQKDAYKINYDYMNRVSDIKVPYSSFLEKNLIKYRKYQWLPKTYALMRYYEPLIANIFNQYGIPQELKYLAIVESNYNPRCVSWVGAKGIWQFMPATGKMYNLYEDRYISLFYEPYASTVAAAKFLKSLYNTHKSWALAISAYNCGSGNVNKAIRRAGTKDYWSVWPYLPKETQEYLTRYQAIKYFDFYYGNYYKTYYDFGINYTQVNVFQVKKKTNFNEFARANNLNLDMVLFLNPQFKTNIIPMNSYVFYPIKPNKK